MYVTRPMSWYLADPNAAAEPPSEGPGSGFLVVVDDEAIERASCCCGLTWDRRVRGLPFPKSRQLALQHSNAVNPAVTGVEFFSEILGSQCCLDVPSGRPPGGHTPAPTDYVVLVPVVGRPLSSRRYYVVYADGKHAGKVSACSKEGDKTTCCFGTCVNDVAPRPFDSADVYQQVKVAPAGGTGFMAEAVVADGIPPGYLRKKGWKVSIASPKYELADDAQGVDRALRRRMPSLDGFSVSSQTTGSGSPPVVVGKWYVPFMFVRADGERRLKDQARRSTFYELTLEQSWEQIYHRTAGEDGTTGKQEVAVTATVRPQTALLGGTDAVQQGSPHVDGGAVWFRPAAPAAVGAVVALDTVLWEGMRWELEREGRVAPGNGDDEVRIDRVERRDAGLGRWEKFACYLLVERFVLRRMDRSVALTCEFRHADNIRAKWA